MTTKLNYRYTLPKGIDWPSVTEVCNCSMKWGLVYFYGKHGIKKAKEIANEAAGVGKGLHSYIHSYYTTRTNVVVESESKELDNTIRNFNLFEKQYQVRPLFVEQVVCSEKHGYVGTFDCLSVDDNWLILEEWKTSKAIYPEYVLQTQAYWTALTEMLKHKTILLPEGVQDLPIKFRIVRFDKEKTFNPKKDIKEFYPNVATEKAFLSLLTYYNWNKNQSKRKGETK